MEAINETNDCDNDSPDRYSFDKITHLADEEVVKIERKNCILRFITINTAILLMVIIIIIISIILLLIIKLLNKPPIGCESGYFIPADSKSKCHKCTLENCHECSGTQESNICSLCIPNYFPFYENNILKSCNICEMGENDKCLSCVEGKNECSKCNDEYILENGKCIPNFSFRAVYYVESRSEKVRLMNKDKNIIKRVLIDGNVVNIKDEMEYELQKGYHTVYILLDFNSLQTIIMFYNCKNLKEIYFSSQFNNIEVKSLEEMFISCESLTSVDFTNFKIKNVKILYGMFKGCSSLKNIDISPIDISNVTNMKRMFFGCKELENIQFPNNKTEELINIEEMFSNCSSLKSLDLSNFDTKKIKSFQYLFNGCKSLTSLNIYNFNTTNATTMDYMFKDCISLVSLDLSNFNTQNVQSMNYMFQGCSSLISINLYNFNTSKVRTMIGLFSGCYSLISLDLSSFNIENLISMREMFHNCSSLISIDFSNFNNFNTKKIANMEYMFQDCSSLTSIDLSNVYSVEYNTVIGMFYGCAKLKYIDISSISINDNAWSQIFGIYVPSGGTIKLKNEITKNRIIDFPSGWKIIYKS